jgi:hypothetical protein
MDLRKIGWNGMDCISLAEVRDYLTALVNTVMNLRVPCTITGFSRRDQLHEVSFSLVLQYFAFISYYSSISNFVDSRHLFLHPMGAPYSFIYSPRMPILRSRTPCLLTKWQVSQHHCNMSGFPT